MKGSMEEDGFQQIFNVVINNSIVGFDNNETKLFLQISLQCIKVIFVPNILFIIQFVIMQISKPKIMDLM